ncbi:MAG: hypothetical protein NTZ56_04030 [Acidobacteria bacterium]|nr:hypothetical protein [Acidobacteriota bacterium]
MNNKVKALIHRLDQMTRDGVVKWKPSVRPRYYATSFTDSSVEIGRPAEGTASSRMGSIELKLIDSRGNVIERVVGVVLSPNTDAAENFQLLGSLLSAVEAVVQPGEKMAEHILAELDKIAS